MTRRQKRDGYGRVLALLSIVFTLVGASAVVPSTPAYAMTAKPDAWYLDSLEVARAHQISRGKGVVVAVIDTGVDRATRALVGGLLPGAQFGTDRSPDGQVDLGAEGHGTSMASLIAGHGAGVTGIAPEARILPVAVDLADAHNIADGLRWATDHGADVANLSLITDQAADEDVADAVRYARRRDVIVVFSAGNVAKTGQEVSGYGRLPGVLTVSGVDRTLAFWPGSARGPAVRLAAPSTELTTELPRRLASRAAVTSGTSGAAALVSGTAALVRSTFPDSRADAVINRMLRTSRDLGPPGTDPFFGAGLVQPLAALTSAVPDAAPAP